MKGYFAILSLCGLNTLVVAEDNLGDEEDDNDDGEDENGWSPLNMICTYCKFNNGIKNSTQHHFENSLFILFFNFAYSGLFMKGPNKKFSANFCHFQW